MQGGRALFEKYGDEADSEWLASAEVDGFKLGDHPKFIRLFGKLAKASMGNAGLKGGDDTMQTPADYQAKIADFRAKHREVLYNESHPEHRLRVSQLDSLYKKAYPVES